MNEINGLHIAVLFLSGIIVILLLIYLFKTGGFSSASSRHNKQRSAKDSETQNTKPCPLCRAPLKQGEKVHSVLYPGKPDSLMEIYGCPYCEDPNSKNERICPVCKKKMPEEAVVIARVFDKPGKKHVHVLGCSVCYSGRSRIQKT